MDRSEAYSSIYLSGNLSISFPHIISLTYNMTQIESITHNFTTSTFNMRVGQALVEVLTIDKILRVKFYEINENMEFPEQNNLYPNPHGDVTILIISISTIYMGSKDPMDICRIFNISQKSSWYSPHSAY